MSDQEFENYLILLSRFLRLTPSQRESISSELRDHLTQRLDQLLQKGVPREEAVRQALEEFGDAASLADQFTSIARNRKRRWMMRLTMTSIFGLAASILLLIAFWPNQNGSPLRTAQADDSATSEGSLDERPVLLTKYQQKVRESLNWKDSFDLQQETLLSFGQLMKDKLGTDVIIDMGGLDDEGIDAKDQLVTLHAKGISNRAAMRLVLEPLGLNFQVRKNFVEITSQSETESNIGPPRAYPVWDLVMPKGADPQKVGPDYDSLISLVTSICTPDMWEEVGGSGTVRGYKGLLMISQTDAVHNEIELLIEALRKVDKETGPVVPADLPSIKRYLKAMHQEINIDYDELPLSEVVEVLSRTLKLPVTIDTQALEDLGLDPSTGVTAESTSIPARSGLAMMLEPLELVAVWKHETVRITSREMAEESLATRVYPVEDVIAFAENKNIDEGRRISAELDNLIDLITTTISPETWDVVGGPSVATSFAIRKAIVCSTTDDVHDDIERLFQLLRDSRKAKNAAPAGVAVEWPSIFVDTYHVEAETEEKVADVIKKMVVPKTWDKDADGYEGAEITTLPGRIMIRQTSRNHDKIRMFLMNAGIGNQGFGKGIQQGGMF